jgi:predicted PurR-regulated permease PerM
MDSSETVTPITPDPTSSNAVPLGQALPEGSDQAPRKNLTKSSPPWGWQVKMIITLVALVIVGFLLVRFHSYINMLLTAFLITFLFQPIVNLLNKKIKISWRVATAIVYLLFALIFGGLAARGGTSLVGFVQDAIANLNANIATVTKFLEEWSQRQIFIGPLKFTMPTLDAQFLSTELLARLQPILTQAGTIAGAVVTFVGSSLFNFGLVYLLSFFLVSESNGSQAKLFDLNLPGYEYDLRRMGREIANIWNAFIRGEFVVVGTAIVIYSILLGSFGLPYFFVLAIIAGLGRFVPYVGAWVGWIAFAVSAFLQTPTPFGLANWAYALLIVGIALVIDTLLDQVLTPRVMGNALEVHPAAIMISALLGAQLLGLIGVILAAPVIATLKLISRYVLRKLMDQDPWEGLAYYKPKKKPFFFKWLPKPGSKAETWLSKAGSNISLWAQSLWQKIRKLFTPKDKTGA